MVVPLRLELRKVANQATMLHYIMELLKLDTFFRVLPLNYRGVNSAASGI